MNSRTETQHFDKLALQMTKIALAIIVGNVLFYIGYNSGENSVTVVGIAIMIVAIAGFAKLVYAYDTEEDDSR